MDTIHVFHNKPDLIKLAYSYSSIFCKISGDRWHPAEKHWGFPNKDDLLEKILKNIPSPLVGEGQGEG